RQAVLRGRGQSGRRRPRARPWVRASRSVAGAGRRAPRRRTPWTDRAGVGRTGHLEHHRAPVAQPLRSAAPPPRPAHRCPGRRGLPHGDRRRTYLRRREHREHRRPRARAGRSAMARRARCDVPARRRRRFDPHGRFLAGRDHDREGGLVMPDGPLLWYVNRSTGLVLLVLLTVTVLLGVWSTRGAAGTRIPRFVLQSVHRNVGLLSMTMLFVHVASAVLDEFVDIRWWQAFVPWSLRYQPWWLGLGIVAVDLLVAVCLTSLVRARLSHRTWWWLHLTTYPAWVAAAVHGWG